ncbi:UvrB/UvrC motif-containing protein [Cuneatibacter caecimuris]|uniref:Protein arginine kinase activator n=1 Tax=Cuneatibacter caecimuris TaxID=1796618 RepID=A0A4Q7PJT5_9FIRM|nr:UvrB/UvrC motif-containing protein [Cuneatibacter caecimuris]RZT00961.1 protein arginine kinase activator [Cuneatibacter caecimuris]
MLCERCGKREATIVLTEVAGGIKTEHKLCSQCASELELGQLFESEFPFGKLLSGILGLTGSAEGQTEEAMEQVVCPTCGTSYGEFVRGSQFGCADCYNTFGVLMQNNIKKLQGNDAHVGKHPRCQENPGRDFVTGNESGETDPAERLRILKSKLQEALNTENYEDAARYRDEIRALKKGNGQDAEMV